MAETLNTAAQAYLSHLCNQGKSGSFDEPRVLSRRPLNAITLEPETIDNLHGTDLLWEALKKRILLLLSGVSLADIAIGTVDPFADDQTDSSPAFGASMQSTARH